MFKRQVQRSRARGGLRALVALSLTAGTVWLSLYFWIQTSRGQAHLISTASEGWDQGAFHLQALGCTSSLTSWWVQGLVIRDVDQQPALSADLVLIDIDPFQSGFAHLHLARFAAEAVGVHLAWDSEGRFNLRPRTPIEPRVSRARTWSIDEVVLSEGDVSLVWPTWSLGFEDVDCEGSLARRATEGLQMSAQLHGGSARLDVEGVATGFDAHAIEGFVWQSRGFEVDRVSVDRRSGDLIEASGSMAFRGGLSMEATGSARLSAVDANGSLADWLPQGGRLSHLRVARRPAAPWAFEVEGLETPSLRLGRSALGGLKTSLELSFKAGGLIPHVRLNTRTFEASSLAFGERLSARGVRLGGVSLALGMASELELQELRIAEASVAGARVEALALEASGAVNIGGGQVSGRLSSDSGNVSVSAPVKTSLLGRQITAALTWGFEEVDGGLAEWVRPWLSSGGAELPEGALDGRALAYLTVGADAGVRWSWGDLTWREVRP